ncbi:MAG: D-tyrosyl-tRNA(Tyr) deacylase [Hahellaceae bacterium]|nr:D-tyrosyl-tRNA(Tyr) deacylase [Hahellaceae bacterium]MCP5168597.1 D-tyrosyl-tRNA(Tyr) deacylase [Hahellaceae bacterium]
MIALIQRVAQASVIVDEVEVGAIGRGVLVLLGVESGDSEEQVVRLVHKVLNYRIFPDSADKMNLSLHDIEGDILVVSQFTLAADTKKGLRPSFSSAAAPEIAQALYEKFCATAAKMLTKPVQKGVFGADMQVSLVNDGPVTFSLKV